jgi:hypothetical protein
MRTKKHASDHQGRRPRRRQGVSHVAEVRKVEGGAGPGGAQGHAPETLYSSEALIRYGAVRE